jgi:hypothetical protein
MPKALTSIKKKVYEAYYEGLASFSVTSQPWLAEVG